MVVVLGPWINASIAGVGRALHEVVHGTGGSDWFADGCVIGDPANQ